MAQKYSADEVIEALHDARGIVSVAAKKLGCSRSTVYNYIERYVTVKDAHKEARETTIDHVESALLKQIDEGNVTAIIFFLKTQGRSRGYGDRTEITTPKDEPMKIEFVYPDAN